MHLALHNVLQRYDCALTAGLRPTCNGTQPSHRVSNSSLLCRLEVTTAEASTQLCTCVFDCNVPLLRRYIKAGILVNAGNFDSRTALHLAAAEANLAAVRLLCKTALLLHLKAPYSAMSHMRKLCTHRAGQMVCT